MAVQFGKVWIPASAGMSGCGNSFIPEAPAPASTPRRLAAGARRRRPGPAALPHRYHVACHVEAGLPLDIVRQVLLWLDALPLGRRRIIRPVLDELIARQLL